MSLFGKDLDKLPIPVTIGGEYHPDAVVMTADGLTVESAVFNLAKAAEKAGYSRVINLRCIGTMKDNYDAMGDAIR